MSMLSVCLYPTLINFLMAEPVYMKLGMYVVAAEPISKAYVIISSKSQSHIATDG
jgi:hypothetical protein